jgi:hypothetical protein
MERTGFGTDGGVVAQSGGPESPPTDDRRGKFLWGEDRDRFLWGEDRDRFREHEARDGFLWGEDRDGSHRVGGRAEEPIRDGECSGD